MYGLKLAGEIAKDKQYGEFKMTDFTKKQIQDMMHTLKWEWGIDNNTRELAVLELKDLQRKGCTLEHIGECRGKCSICDGVYCPLDDWEKRHPEYKDDELARKINVLEAGGEEAYRAKMQKKLDAENAVKTWIAHAVEARNKLVTMSLGDHCPDDIRAELEKYVQIRINLALKHGTVTLDAQQP